MITNPPSVLTKVANATTVVNKDTLSECATNVSSNHLQKSKRRPPGQSVRQVKDTQELESLGLYAINDKSVKPFTVDLKLNGKLLCMKLDTGATVSLVSEKTFHQLFP